MKKLENKKVVVTGGCKGIGRAIVERCLQEGAIVAATYFKSKDYADEMIKELGKNSNKLSVYNMDICNEEQVKSVMEHIQSNLDGVDILVNNSGISHDGLLCMLESDHWDRVMKTNIYGPFYTSKSVLLNMIRKKSGSIVNIASVSGVIGIAGQSNYCASKFGLIGLTKSLAKELAIKNIRVNAVAPGYVDTDMIKGVNAKIKSEVLDNKQSLRRVATPDEIARIVSFLASDDSSYITGQVIIADGGITV